MAAFRRGLVAWAAAIAKLFMALEAVAAVMWRLGEPYLGHWVDQRVNDAVHPVIIGIDEIRGALVPRRPVVEIAGNGMVAEVAARAPTPRRCRSASIFR